jgi:hypothetical protein
MSRWTVALALVAFGCAACGGDAPQTPAGPSSAVVASPGALSVTQGAKILGNVSAGVPLAALAAQVMGTPISAPVGAGGGFSLEGVPEGDVQLRFVGSGVDASVALTPVRPGDVVSLLVGVAGATAMVQSESRNAGGKVELEGRVESLTASPETLVVAGRTVTTTAATAIRDGNDGTKTFADLAIGQRVHVKGTLGVDGLVADSILIQNTITTIPVNVNGIVDNLSGDAASFAFFIGSREIRGDGTTVLYGDDGVLLTFAALVGGARVEVKGEMRDGFVFAVRIHVNGPMEPPQDDSASVEGVLDALTGTAPDLTLSLLTKFGTVTVTTTVDTIVQRRGDVQPLAAVAVGQTIHAVGVRQTDGTLAAMKLQIKDDATDGRFTIEGSLGGLKGTCPAISFGVNGYSIFTTAADPVEYLPAGTACGDLKSGMKIEVGGVRQAGGTVLASKVTRK